MDTQESSTQIVTETGAPSRTTGLPKAIMPASTASPGNEYQVITVGFKEALNYPFVVNHGISSAQIFDYLPSVLVFPFRDDDVYHSVSVKRLVPYSAPGIDYLITVAEVYFPKDAAVALLQLVERTDSKLYHNPDGTENELSQLIDNRVPVIGLSLATSSGESDTQENGSLGSEDSGGMKSGTVAGMITGASLGAIAYMSLMILLFKRIQKKRKLALLSSDSESDMSGSVRLGRPAISSPVNALNSLGWSSQPMAV